MVTKKKAVKKKVVKKKAAPKKKVVKKTVKKKAARRSAGPKHTQEATEKRHRAFALEYIIDFNGTRAAEVCGYSKKTAKQQGSRLLTYVDVQKYIAEAMVARNERTENNADFVLNELGNMARADPLDIIDPDTLGFRPITEWPLEWRRMLSAVDVSEIQQYIGDGVRVKVGDMVKMKFPDRLRILEVLGKHVDVQAFLNKVQVEEKDSLSDRMARARKRVLDDATATRH